MISSSELGTDCQKGNIVGIQPAMQPSDYLTEARFLEKLDGYFRFASAKGWLSERSVVVLPEYLCLWLLLLGESPSLGKARSISGAMIRLILRHPGRFLSAWFRSPERQRLRASLFRMKAQELVSAQQRVFSQLSSRYRVTIVAGSSLLPEPRLNQGRLEVEVAGPMRNASFVYCPDGSLHRAIVRKVHPIGAEEGLIQPGTVAELPVYDTPAGRLGVLICADSWYPDVYLALKDRQVSLIVVPAYLDKPGLSQQPWKGYDPGPAPSDVNLDDRGVLTEEQAWMKYALAGRIASSGARAGLTVFLRGNFWSMSSDGRPIAAQRDHAQVLAADQPSDSISCVWVS